MAHHTFGDIEAQVQAGPIDRRRLDQLGFGRGVHGCAGQSLGWLEAHAVFGALA